MCSRDNNLVQCIVLALFTFSLLGYIFLFLAFMFSWYLSLANLARGMLLEVLAVMFPGGDDINFEAPSWRLGEGSRLVVGVRLLFLDGRVLDSTG